MSPWPRVCVVGGGVVGVTAALLLERSGFPVQLIEPRPADESEALPTRFGLDLRTLALSPASLTLLESAGVALPALAEHACFYPSMEVWDSEGTGRIRFDAVDVDREHLGCIVTNREVLAALWSALRRSDVELWTGCGVSHYVDDGRCARITLEDERVIDADLIVAADGGASRMRTLAGIGAERRDMHQVAIATIARTAAHHQNTAWQTFLPTGPVALLPLPGTGHDGPSLVSVVWSAREETARELRMLDDAAFAGRLERAVDARLGAVLEVDARIGFPLAQSHARQYRAARLVLVGDAAHVIHPMAGQGVNLGLQDVALLDRELRRGVAGAAGAASDPAAWLTRFERERRQENALMLSAMRGLSGLFGATDPLLALLRNQGLRWVGATPLLKQQFIRHALGVAA